MKSPFVWGKGGRAMTPEEVDRERQLVALARAKMGDTSPVGHWTQGATRVVDALGAVLREKRTNKAEAAGLASADERIAAILAGQGGAGGGVYASTSGGGSPSGTWTPDATPGPVAQATQGVTGGLSFPGQPAADTGVAQGGLSFGSAVMTPQEMLIEGAKRRGLDPIDVATAISYETGGKFDPTIKGPTTQWGTHEGLIQFGDPQGEKYGVDFSSPEAAWRTQLDPTSGGVWGYLEDTGVKPGMGLPEIYSAINAGAVGRMGASDANNGGAPGTVADKVAGMGAHRDKAAAFLGGTWTPNPDAGGGAVTMSTSGPSGGYGGGGTGGVDIASLLALQKNPWVAKKYGGVVDALMGQQFSRQNALWEQQQKMADPMYQAQLAELTAPKVSDYDARAAAAAQYGLQPGTPEYQRFVLAGDVAVPGGANLPAGVQELQWRAEQAGLVPGTPEYQSFIINGGGDPATYRALEMQAINAGLVKGTPEFQQFMATRGAGQAAYAGQAGENAANIETGGAAAGAVAAGKVQGEAAANAEVAAPADISVADRTLGYIDEVRNHPGKGQGTGLSSYGNWIPGTSGKDFQNRVDQLKSGAFLSAIDELRGMGSLSNAEGQTATAAITRMDTATSEKEFDAALADYEEIVKLGRDRAAKRLKAPEDAAAPDAVPAADLPAAPVAIKNDAEYDALPSGTIFLAPDGKTRVKP